MNGFMPGFAFGISEEDVLTVLDRSKDRIVDKTKANGGFQYAEKVFEGLDTTDHGRIERAALDGGDELDAQTDAALDELEKVLVENGVLAPKA